MALGFGLGVAPVSAQNFKAGQREKQLKEGNVPLPGPALQRFLRMTPEERRQALAQLPPARRQQLLQRLNRLLQLTPEQRETLVRHYQTFQGMAPGRRLLVRQAITRLRLVSDERRKEYLDSTEAKLLFTPTELQFIGEVVGLPELE